MTTPVPVPPPAYRPRIPARGQAPSLTSDEVLALEAFADTVIPGRKRSADDVAIAGVSSTPGAVECGALVVLTDPATGIEDGVAGMAFLLDQRARNWASAEGVFGIDRFADLPYPLRRRVLTDLTGPSEPQKDFWFLMALFATMAYDSAPHLETADALDPAVTPASGLQDMGFRTHVNGRWSFTPASYGRPMAQLRAGTDHNGDPR